jgi:hypothetical protein
MRKY